MSDTPRTAPFTGAPLPDPGDDLPEPPRLRALRRLVTGLTVTLIAGVVIITGALVMRISGGSTGAVPLDATRITAEDVMLPPGEQITATGGSGGTLMLVTEAEDGREVIYLIDGTNGRVLRRLSISRTSP